MFNKITTTFLTKFFSGLFSLGLVVLAAQYLGAEGRGDISLLMLNITIIVLVSEFAGGGALVYLLPRFNFYQLLIPSYIWAILSASIASGTITFFQLSPSYLLPHLFGISLLYSINAVHLNLLLGLERIKQHNIASFLQITGIAISFTILLTILEKWELESYIYSLYVGSTIGIITTTVLLFNRINHKPKERIITIFKTILSNGFVVQIGNIFQLLNYRLGYYFIELFNNTASLGIYSTAAALAEALWLITKSISMVQYARISNSNNLEYARNLTIKLIKFSFLSTFSLLILISLLPKSIFITLFGQEFEDVKLIIILLSPGIVAFSTSNMLSHYFSGIGRFEINSKSSALGLVVTTSLGLILIPLHGIIGAAMTASISYITSTIYQFVIFKNDTKLQFKELLITKNDTKEAKKQIYKLLGKKKSSNQFS